MSENINKTPTCIHCAMEIPPNALVCHNCNREQKRGLRAWRLWLPHFVSLTMVLLAGVQLVIALRQKHDATLALQKARQIETRVNQSGKAIAESLVVLSFALDGTVGGLTRQQYLPPALKQQAEDMFSALGVQQPERDLIISGLRIKHEKLITN